MSVDPRSVTSSNWAPAGIAEEQAKLTGFGVFAAGATGLGGTKGPGEATGLKDGEELAIATGVVLGVCRAAGAALPQAVSTSRAGTSAATLMLVITVRQIECYELRILTRRGDAENAPRLQGSTGADALARVYGSYT